MFPIRFRCLALGSLLAVVSLVGVSAHADEPRARLDVQAEAQLEVVPDRATLSARLWERTPAVSPQDEETDSNALREARDRLEERATALIRALEEAGVERDDISAGRVNCLGCMDQRAFPQHCPSKRPLSQAHMDAL